MSSNEIIRKLVARIKKYTEFRKDDRPAGWNGCTLRDMQHCGAERRRELQRAEVPGQRLLSRARGTGFTRSALGSANSLVSEEGRGDLTLKPG